MKPAQDATIQHGRIIDMGDTTDLFTISNTSEIHSALEQNPTVKVQDNQSSPNSAPDQWSGKLNATCVDGSEDEDGVNSSTLVDSSQE